MKGELIDLTLPLFSGAPIWSPEPKTVITDFFTIGRNYGASEQMNMKFSTCAAMRAPTSTRRNTSGRGNPPWTRFR